MCIKFYAGLWFTLFVSDNQANAQISGMLEKSIAAALILLLLNDYYGRSLNGPIVQRQE